MIVVLQIVKPVSFNIVECVKLYVLRGPATRRSAADCIITSTIKTRMIVSAIRRTLQMTSATRAVRLKPGRTCENH